MDPRTLTIEFNNCINGRDLAGLEQLMTDDHTFIDTADRAIHGKADCLKAWRGFFESFPDYRNIFESVIAKDDRVIVVGRSTCSDVRLDGPALWVARASNAKLAEWRVHEDSPANRQALGIT